MAYFICMRVHLCNAFPSWMQLLNKVPGGKDILYIDLIIINIILLNIIIKSMILYNTNLLHLVLAIHQNMATAVPTPEELILPPDQNCGFCLRHVTEMEEPRALPCSHIFCKECIENKGDNPAEQLDCPLCE